MLRYVLTGKRKEPFETTINELPNSSVTTYIIRVHSETRDTVIALPTAHYRMTIASRAVADSLGARAHIHAFQT